MFDSTHVTHQHRYGPSHVTVTEKRAPTDESVRLLKEMEQAARDKIVSSFDLESNTIKGRVFAMKDYVTGKNNFAAIVDINGKRTEIKVSVNDYEPKEEQIKEIYKAIGERLAAEIMPDVIKASMNEGML